MFDHLGFRVRDLAASRRFYDAVAAAVGLQTVDNTPESFVMGRSAQEPIPFLWVGTTQPAFWTAGHATSASPIHLAFAPGLRRETYYAAYVLDPDGNNIEAGVWE